MVPDERSLDPPACSTVVRSGMARARTGAEGQAGGLGENPGRDAPVRVRPANAGCTLAGRSVDASRRINRPGTDGGSRLEAWDSWYKGAMQTSTRRFGAQSMTGRLRRVLVNRPGPAYGGGYEVPGAGYASPVDLPRAQAEHDGLVAILRAAGAEVEDLGRESGPDSIYTFDPVLVTDRGAILLRIGKDVRRDEAAVMGTWLQEDDIPVLAELEAPATADGGDILWLDDRTLVIGRTLRTNRAGTGQVAEAVAGLGVDVHIVDMPWWTGPDHCLHLLSVISPADHDLAVIYRPLLPAGLWELLQERGIATVDVPEEEWPTLGPNVLALGPREVVILSGNDRTAAALEAAGCLVHVFDGAEVAVKGSGGPTCLTRPLLRDPVAS
jgi:N-dimethylarginine dimethylaminohydrolase